jgi:prepilin-type N-terminal cleavage/methylation domain-containing protein
MDIKRTPTYVSGRLRLSYGYTLIELIVVLLIIGALASVAVKSLSVANRTARAEETKRELEHIAFAIAGNPDLVSGGSRTDFGFIGDMGSFPPDLNALVANPGGWITWQGPYISDKFSTDGSSSRFQYDAWGVAYDYSGGIAITSVGGPESITRQLANSAADLLYNQVSLVVVDLDNTPPGTDYKDSIDFVLDYPDGAGSISRVIKNPGGNGYVQFDSIPVGSHLVRIVYVPDNDTLVRRVTVEPGEDFYSEVVLGANYRTGGP